MKKGKSIAIAMMMMFALSGCVKTPDNLGQESENAEVQNKETDGLTFDTVENILKNVKNIKEYQFDNLYYNQELEVNEPKEIGQMEFKQKDDFDEEGMQILKKFIGELNPEVKIDTNFDIPGLQYIDTKNQKSCSLGNEGFLYYATEEGDSWGMVVNDTSDEYVFSKQVCVETPYEEENFEYNGKSVTLSEMVEAAQKHADEFTEQYDSMQWIPSSVKIYKNTVGEYFFQFQFTKSYKGMYMFYRDYRKCMDTVNEPYVCVMQPYLVMDSSKKLLVIDNYPGIIEYSETKKSYDEIITLECASQRLSEKLSSYKAYHVYDVNLEYRLVQTSGATVDDPTFYYSNWIAGNTYEARPCWTFYLSNDLEHMTFAMVDCITGEVEFVSGE